MPQIAIADTRKIDDYTAAVKHTGADIRVVGTPMSIEEALDGIDGVLLTGGDDVAPHRYGEDRHPTVVEVAPGRDDFEIALVREARARRLPMLGICRGMQVLNVACGGSLVQDIPTQVTGALQHRFRVPPHDSFKIAHEVLVDQDSRLAQVLREQLSGSGTCGVNSRHHQAVKQLAPGLRIVATAPDGVVEAIEDPALPFCVAVQWHPENFWRTGEFRSLFESLASASSQPR